jgi:hypothetical protein
MTTTEAAHDYDTEREAIRVMGFFGVLLANVASFGILFFWLIGAVLMLTGNGGQLLLLGLDGLALVLFWSLPLVVLVSLAAWFLYLARLDLPAIGLAGAPIALTVLYYLWLVLLRNY